MNRGSYSRIIEHGPYLGCTPEEAERQAIEAAKTDWIRWLAMVLLIGVPLAWGLWRHR
jgi:hypothetical protein